MRLLAALISLAISVCLLVSCEDPKKAEAALLARDAVANGEVNRINSLLSSAQPPTSVDIDSLKRIHAKYPNSTVVRQLLQNVYVKRGDWEAAASLLSSVPSADATDNLTLAKIYINQGRHPEAVELLEKINAAAADTIETSALLAQAQFYVGRTDDAIRTLEGVQAQLETKERADSLALLGTAYLRRGEHEKAVTILRKAIQLAPENISAHNAVIRAFAASGNTAEADVYRAKLEAINQRIAAEEKRKSRIVPLFYELEKAYAARDHSKVIDLATRLTTEADARSLPAVYQYLAAAYRARGETVEADKAFAEAQRLSQK